ncbi:hypothetical protein LG409_02650 [Halomonas sp. NyZ770]|uniref:hypothetical protein n=1 Tax=Halomonas sp. NyZ770 TaxID=2883106 RepID=UPI001D0AB0CB|nr:hypothetical protein [Halomonas sp. NyZ770]UDM07821.1 hypothetical protein LG409_02650 [Halomonas sp. NyZ770]
MLQALIAFVTVLSGYLFITKWHESRYIIRRQDSQGVYFYAAAAGITLLVVSVFLVSLMEDHLLWATKTLSFWVKAHLPLSENESSMAVSYWIIVLGMVFTICIPASYILNFLQGIMTMQEQDWVLLVGNGIKGRRFNPSYYLKEIYGYSSSRPLYRAITHMNADFELILFRGMDQAKPICFTLKNGKVYVGRLMGSVDPVDSRDMLRVLPLMSGFRDPVTHKVTFTTFYKRLYDRIPLTQSIQHLDEANFELVFGFLDVQSAHLFNTKVYDEFQKDGPVESNQINLDLDSDKP